MDAYLLILGWQVLGFLIAVGISAGSLLALFQYPARIGTFLAESFLAIFMGILIGGIVASIGAYATLVKISVESAYELRLQRS